MRPDNPIAVRKQNRLLRYGDERRRFLRHFAERSQRAGESEIALAFRKRCRDATRAQMLLRLARALEFLGQRRIASALRLKVITQYR